MRREGIAACVAVAACTVLLTLSGCAESGQYDTAPVKGSVTFEGKPVEGGALTFVPAGAGSGKPGAAQVQSDGTYVLGTYVEADGAVLGKHKVSYSPPTVELPEGVELQPGESTPPSPWDGLVPKTAEVEVAVGSNRIDIELVAPGAADASSTTLGRHE